MGFNIVEGEPGPPGRFILSKYILNSMIGWFIRSAVDLTWTIEYAVQIGRAHLVSFVWLLPLTGLRATESGVDRRVFGVVAIVSTLMSVAPWLAVAVVDI